MHSGWDTLHVSQATNIIFVCVKVLCFAAEATDATKGMEITNETKMPRDNTQKERKTEETKSEWVFVTYW